MRICLVYDCLYPWTVGGAERWYRAMAEHLSEHGHAVTYLTLRQWPSDNPAVDERFDVVSVGPRLALYDDGRRRIWPPLRFGLGVLAHLIRHGGEYDIVHCASFPYFSALAAAAVRPLGRYHLIVDWWEVWTAAYWRTYLGRWKGRIGLAIQHILARLPHHALCFSRLHATRLEAAHGRRADIVRGVYPSPPRRPDSADDSTEGLSASRDPVVVFAGRHIPEKRPAAIPPAVALARRHMPRLRATILGDGPERPRVVEVVRGLGVEDTIEMPGFVPEPELTARLHSALCLVLPSLREGFGLTVLDAISQGTPAVVVQDPDNAATDLIVPGVNGVIAASASPDDLANAILEIEQWGEHLRRSTALWWRANREGLSIESGLARVLAIYEELAGGARVASQPGTPTRPAAVKGSRRPFGLPS